MGIKGRKEYTINNNKQKKKLLNLQDVPSIPLNSVITSVMYSSFLRFLTIILEIITFIITKRPIRIRRLLYDIGKIREIIRTIVSSIHKGVIMLKNDSIPYSSSKGNSWLLFLLLFRNIEYLANKNGLYTYLRNIIIIGIELSLSSIKKIL